MTAQGKRNCGVMHPGGCGNGADVEGGGRFIGFHKQCGLDFGKIIF
jgi:hypothetical protein